MDWQYVGSVLGVIRELVVTVAAAMAGIAALLGVNAWRRQLAGKNEYEAGLRVLRSAFGVRDAMAVVRNPFMSSGEMAAALAEDSPPEPQPDDVGDDFMATFATYRVRWGSVVSAMQELDMTRVEAEALWGADADAALAGLRKCVSQLRWAVDAHLRDRRHKRGGTRSPELFAKMDNILYWTSDDPVEDPFTAEIQAAVTSVESFVRPKLK